MEFPDPPYDLYRPMFGDDGPDPRRQPPRPPHASKRLRVFGVVDNTNNEAVGPPPTTLPNMNDSIDPRVGLGSDGGDGGGDGPPTLRDEFRRVFRMLNELLLEQCGYLQNPGSVDVNLEERAQMIVQRRTELQ